MPGKPWEAGVMMKRSIDLSRDMISPGEETSRDIPKLCQDYLQKQIDRKTSEIQRLQMRLDALNSRLAYLSA